MVSSTLALKWLFLDSSCGMDHKKLTILLIFGTLSIGGCGGQGCHFWPNQRLISKNSTIQDSQTTFKPKLACIFLSVRAKWSIKVCVGTPCINQSKIQITENFKSLSPKFYGATCQEVSIKAFETSQECPLYNKIGTWRRNCTILLPKTGGRAGPIWSCRKKTPHPSF